MCRDVASQHMKVKNTQLSHCFGISFRNSNQNSFKANLNDVKYELCTSYFLNIACLKCKKPTSLTFYDFYHYLYKQGAIITAIVSNSEILTDFCLSISQNIKYNKIQLHISYYTIYISSKSFRHGSHEY
jgi:hypothetical protein